MGFQRAVRPDRVMRVAEAGSECLLHWAFRGMSEPLTRRHGDTFELPAVPSSPGGLLPGLITVAFSADRDGNIAGAAMPLDPLVNDIAFARSRIGNCTLR